jgi:1-acyl-sn-glycerol-3-phosphate acyltransferase
MATTAMRVANRVAAPVVRRLLRPEVTGADALPPHGGAMLAVNHVSNLDNYLLSAVTPRPVWYLGKRELAQGLVGAFNVAMGMVPVDRGGADLSALRRIAGLLRAGELVAVFPEGTRSPDGALFRFRSGVARIAHLAGVPTFPVGLRGTATVWPRGRGPQLRRPARGTLAVRFGDPVPPPAAAGGRERRAWTEALRRRVGELSGQPLAGAFAPVERGA